MLVFMTLFRTDCNFVIVLPISLETCKSKWKRKGKMCTTKKHLRGFARYNYYINIYSQYHEIKSIELLLIQFSECVLIE